MMFIAGFVVGGLICGVVGILFGRRNRDKVEKAVTETNKVIDSVKAKL